VPGVPPVNGAAKASTESPRLRFAKAEIAKALRALELADSSELTAWLRVLDLEDQIADTRKDLVEMRQEREVLRRIAAGREAPA